MRVNKRKGSLMLMLLALLVVIGLASVKIIPEKITETQREDEVILARRLSDIRNSVALERVASTSSLYYGNWENQAELVAYLNDLVSKNFLSETPKDPLCPEYLWGTGPGKKFWVPTRNLLGSSSFETDSFAKMPWLIDETNVNVNLHSDDWPGKESGSLDNFPFQNRFGNQVGFTGQSLALQQK